MRFDKEKKEFLSKKDKSRKGSIDAKIRNLVDKLNSFPDYFSTSSCAGRILLITAPESNKKNEVKYLFCSHDKIKSKDFKKLASIIESKLPKDDVWLRIEPAILHVACENTTSAKNLLNLARNIGFRRSGIISIGRNRITLELVSTEKIDAIVSKNGKLLIEESYFKVLVQEGNEKLEKTWQKINKLCNGLHK
jgi:tRNA wybutosine-synthesizing protein 3